MSRKAYILTAVIAIAIIVGINILFVPQSSTQPTAAAPAFDHSDCQYPTRWSNPVDGCDNSDPAVPECVGKGTTQAEENACINAYVQANNPQPVATPPATTTPPKNQCGE